MGTSSGPRENFKLIIILVLTKDGTVSVVWSLGVFGG